MTKAETVDPQSLPQPILDFLADSTGNDRPSTIRFFAETARVDDQGESFSGTSEVQAWLNKTTGLFDYTLEISSAQVRDDGMYAVRNHLVSDVFPGGETHSTFVFALDEDRITYLTFQ